MRRIIAITALLSAWICANGAIWDAVQVFAWSRMFAGYAQQMSVTAALRETFDPAKPCELCGTVTKAKAGEKRTLPQPEGGSTKLELACETAATVVESSPRETWASAPPPRLVTRTPGVLLRPPRA
ncbi:MAG TPA: hypothetical protein VM029_05420 [Opitutaceae bacterium]|nr:hypothetical protein [Opitutaceae bacterium]